MAAPSPAMSVQAKVPQPANGSPPGWPQKTPYRYSRRLFRIALLGATTLASAAVAAPQPTNVTGNNGQTPLPTGQFVTPQVAGVAPWSRSEIRGRTHPIRGGINEGYAMTDRTRDGSEMYVINGKSDSGSTPYLTGGTPYLANTTYPGGNTAAYIAVAGQNTYQFDLEHATLVSGTVPTATQLAALTTKVASNNFYTAQLSSAEQAEIAALQAQITHVIYIVKENRTFDQILGDLTNGANADPSYAVFGKRITPNFHQLATNFVTLDNSFDAADGSMDGWSLATRGLVTTTEEITQQINYGGHGLAYETEGNNRNVPIAPATEAARDTATGGAYTTAAAGLPGGAANLLPGLANVTSPDAPYGIQKGFIYDAVLAAGKTVRNYGFLVNNSGAISNAAYPGGFTHPGPDGANVVQVAPADPDLLDKTDLYFRGFDQNVPDLWRFNEWNREFQAYVTNGGLPSLETVRFSHDHMGGLGTAQAGMVSPEQEQADDDYTVGKLVDTVAHSPYASNTLIIVTEDDSQDGPDHVDSHRTTTYVVGPYVKKNAVVSVRYNMVSILRTIEDILGTPHMNLNTAYQRPMLEVFDTSRSNLGWTYSATASTVLKTTTLITANESGVRYAEGPDVVPTHDRAYWAKATAGFDFSDADRIPHDLFNRVVWEGVMGDQPYPERAASATAD